MSRRALVEAFSHALFAADPQRIIRYKVKLDGDRLRILDLDLPLSDFERVLVIGGGKASANMAIELERVLDARITGGSVNIPDYTKPWPRSSRITFNPASHPIPGEKGVRGVQKMLDLVGEASRNDLVFCLISGGGSALMPLPADGLHLSDKRMTTQLLLKSGASIEETNTVRKHLSGIKGGRLAERLYPATVVSLIISDVMGDPLGSIASGPTVPDDTSFSDACQVLQDRGLWRKVSGLVRKHLLKGKEGGVADTPESGSIFFTNVHNLLVATNKDSCSAAASVLENMGYHTLILSNRLQGEAAEVGKVLASVVSSIRDNDIPMAPPAAIVAGGETTVTVRGNGKGGRNQELALSAAVSLQGMSDVLISSIGTDGIDGPTKAAGAVADGGTIERARKKRLDASVYLRENNSNQFFQRTGDLIITGPTGTNVNDIMIAIVEGEHRKETVTGPEDE